MNVNMPAAPLVSIIIPTRNRPAALYQCVAACLRLDYPTDRLEVVVIDDGSEPPVPPFDDPRVRVIRQKNAGPATARNQGIRASKGDWIAFTDDDCRPCPDWLSRLAAACLASPASLAGGHTRNALPANPFASAAQALVDYLYGYFENHPRQRFFTSNNMMASRVRLLEIGGFDETFPLPAAEDRDLCDRWTASHGNLLYLPTAVVDHLHDLTFAGFLRQQFRYGRGARVLQSRRAARGLRLPFEGWKFYTGLFLAPFRSHSASRALSLWGLILLSQAANLAGFCAEFLAGRSPGPTK